MQVHLLGVYLQDRLEAALLLITNRKKYNQSEESHFIPVKDKTKIHSY